MKEKKTAIVTGGTKNQFPAIAVLALNIADKCPNIADELVIFHDGVSVEEQQKIKKIFPTRFIEYKSPFMDNTEFTNTISNYFSLMVFCKYECWKLLDEYSCVIWSDYDILILKDISEINIKGKQSSKFIQKKYLISKFEKNIFWDFDYLLNDFNPMGDCISCGIFVLYDNFPKYLDFYRQCLKLTQDFAPVLWLPEEGIISILLQKENIKYDNIDEFVYATPRKEYKKYISISKIIHSVGQPKFWNDFENLDWNEYYYHWINEYKGMPFEKSKKQKNNYIKKIIKYLLPYGLIRFYQKIKQN